MKLQKDDKWLKDARDLVLAKFPALGATMSRLEIVSTNIPTAATDNKKIYYSKEFMLKLTTSEQAFIIAHEVMHVEFEHIQRTLKRDKKVWNIATDAVINQLLVNAGLDMPDNVVNMPEAINKSAEDVYQELLGDPSKVENIMQQNGGENNFDNPGLDDHSNWEEVAKKEFSVDNKEKKSEDKQSKQNSIEKDFAKKNEELKEEIVDEIREKLSQGVGNSTQKDVFAYGNIAKQKPVVNWKNELKKEVEKDEDVWSYRRANKQNYYCARQETFELADKAQTEILLDTSGSVSDSLLRSFLSQVRPILKESEVKVACFDSIAYDFVAIKKECDIDTMKIVGRGGTNFDEAIKAFTSKKEVNKIIFTDGCSSVNWSLVPQSKKNIIWVVYDNNSFRAKYGKVINVDSNKLLSAVKKENNLQFDRVM